MISWIEAQSTLIISLLMLSFCYVMAAAAFGCGVILSRRSVGDELKTVSPVTLTPLAVILGLLIAFIAGRIWENVAHANEHVGQETSALSEIMLLSNALPTEIGNGLRAAVKQHVAFIEENDWPAMARLQTNSFTESASLRAGLTMLLSFNPSEQSYETSRQRVIQSFEKAFEARQNRIRLSKAQIAPIQWTVIVVLTLLILLTTAMIHIGRPAAMAITLFIFSTAIGACLILLMAYDRPFSAGGVSVTPAAFRDILLN